MEGIEIVAVGREILLGATRDSNSFWLAGQISGMGGRISRFTAVDDDVDDIARSIREALGRGAECIITTGGLGPTFDDLTLKGIARATRRRLVLNQDALSFVRRRYRYFYRQGYVDAAEINPAREKMAWLPRGAEMLGNPVGSAPGVLLRQGPRMIICLPGVPAEMKGIFEGSVKKILRKLLKGSHRWQGRIRSGVGDESEMAGAIESLVKKHKGVHIKSHPETFGRETSLEIEITVEGETGSEARRIGERVERELRKLLEIN